MRALRAAAEEISTIAPCRPPNLNTGRLNREEWFAQMDSHPSDPLTDGGQHMIGDLWIYPGSGGIERAIEVTLCGSDAVGQDPHRDRNREFGLEDFWPRAIGVHRGANLLPPQDGRVAVGSQVTARIRRRHADRLAQFPCHQGKFSFHLADRRW